MKFIKILSICTLFSTTFAAELVPSGDTSQINAFKGNWTETFELPEKVGAIIHTPTQLYFESAGMKMDVGTVLKVPAGTKWNKKKLPAELNLSTDLTRDEFVQALIKARIYGENYNGAK